VGDEAGAGGRQVYMQGRERDLALRPGSVRGDEVDVIGGGRELDAAVSSVEPFDPALQPVR
jgi:hypothetical protein